MTLPNHDDPFVDWDTDRLFRHVGSMTHEYQKSRSLSLARYLADLFEILGHHPEVCDCAHNPCELKKLAQQWSWLAANHSEPGKRL